MLVQVAGVVGSAGGADRVEVRTPVGTVVARWCGASRAVPGTHHVEWDLDQEFRWGLTCSPADVDSPRVRGDEHGSLFRGRLVLEATTSAPVFAHLELAGAVIALGHVDALPEGVSGSWVELHLEPGTVAVHPYLV